MDAITVDSETAEKLRRVGMSVEIRDPSGRVLGRFHPFFDPNEWEGLSPEISEEELERRSREKGKTYTTAEVLKHLESLGGS